MTPMIESFVMHFGEMGSRWGFNRTVGQMYALLVISETPLSANQIAEALSVSRGKVLVLFGKWPTVCLKSDVNEKWTQP